jgi:hypothetical protein
VGDTCATPANIQVEVKGPFKNGRCRGNKKLLKVTTLSMPVGDRILRDTDTMRLECQPAPAGCNPQALFTGTFDRIQRQIFNQTCALSGCHDSQSRTGELLLEPGAAHGSLVNVDPSNAAAAAAGWKRVTVLGPTSGDPATSLLLAKLVGPPAGFGPRMPFNRPKLDQSLIDIVQLWIAAGAPTDGWVPGTDQ